MDNQQPSFSFFEKKVQRLRVSEILAHQRKAPIINWMKIQSDLV